MSLTENELIYLMAYVDHQVDDDELPEVHDLLERSEEARLIVAQHAALGDWVRTSNDLRAAEAGADRIASHVMTEIESLGGAKVIEIERERGRVALNRQRVKEFGTLFAIAAVVLAFWAMPTKKPDVVAVAPSTRPDGRAERVPASAVSNRAFEFCGDRCGCGAERPGFGRFQWRSAGRLRPGRHRRRRAVGRLRVSAILHLLRAGGFRLERTLIERGRMDRRIGRTRFTSSGRYSWSPRSPTSFERSAR